MDLDRFQQIPTPSITNSPKIRHMKVHDWQSDQPQPKYIW